MASVAVQWQLQIASQMLKWSNVCLPACAGRKEIEGEQTSITKGQTGSRMMAKDVPIQVFLLLRMVLVLDTSNTQHEAPVKKEEAVRTHLQMALFCATVD